MKNGSGASRIPLPGQRIGRSMIAVWLCFGVYFLRGRTGIPFYSVIAALQCMQPYNRDMGKVAQKRVVGTLIGAGWGLAVLLLELELLYEGVPDELPHYLLLGLFTGVVLYSAVLLRVREAAYFSVVVFLSVAVNHIGDANPYLFAFRRLLDTVIGVLVAEFVNRVHLPRLRRTDTLFVSGVGDTILGADRTLSPYSRVELNRLIDDGAKFTLSTCETPATVRELLSGVDLRLPIITMSGAALYSVPDRAYLRCVPLTEAKSRRVMAWLDEQGCPYFSNSVEEDLLVIRYRALANPGMEQMYARKRVSPYRNFVRSETDPAAQILYFLVLETPERAAALREAFTAEPWAGEYRVVTEPSEFEGYVRWKIYDAAVSKAAMLRVLEERLGTRETVTMGSTPGDYDVYIRDADRDQVVKELKRRFEPVDLRGWRNIFRL